MRTIEGCLAFSKVELFNRPTIDRDNDLELAFKIESDDDKIILHTFTEDDGSHTIWIHYSNHDRDICELKEVSSATFTIDDVGLYIKVRRGKHLVCNIPEALRTDQLVSGLEALIDLVLRQVPAKV